MAGGETGKELSSFLHSGIYRFPNSIAVFMDPVRVLNDSYTRFRVSPSSYYSRFCEPKENEDVRIPGGESRKRKRKKGKHDLNERERSAEKRHQVNYFSFLSFFLLFLIEAVRLGSVSINPENENSL